MFRENPDARLIDRAKKFNVGINTIFYALKKMNITRKKKNFVTKKERQKKELNIAKDSEN